MHYSLRVNPPRPLRASFTAAATLGLFLVLGYPLAPSTLQAFSASAPGLLSCPSPVHEGETWITRRWISGGAMHIECTHVPGIPQFDWPTARKAGRAS